MDSLSKLCVQGEGVMPVLSQILTLFQGRRLASLGPLGGGFEFC
jgi:hypothetical protein